MFEVTVDEREWARAPKERQAEVRGLKARLARDPFSAGENIRRELIPAALGVPNRYRRAMRDDWRMVYTTRTKDVPPTVRILLISDHKRYDRFFGYDAG